MRILFLILGNSGILSTIFVTRSGTASVAVALRFSRYHLAITSCVLPMARYTNFFMTGAPKEEVHQGLVSALEGCGLDLVYQDPVYIVA